MAGVDRESAKGERKRAEKGSPEKRRRGGAKY